jgi:hypothetical protein
VEGNEDGERDQNQRSADVYDNHETSSIESVDNHAAEQGEQQPGQLLNNDSGTDSTRRRCQRGHQQWACREKGAVAKVCSQGGKAQAAEVCWQVACEET